MSELCRSRVEGRDSALAKSSHGSVHRQVAFAGAHAQIALVRRWNLLFKWGIGHDEFRRCSESIPPWPLGPLSCLVLVPYLTSPQATFDALWGSIVAQYPGSWIDQVLRSAHIEPDTVTEAKNTLRWTSLDLGTARGRVPEEPSSTARGTDEPGVEVIAAAAIHGGWTQLIDRRNVPAIWLPRYRVNTHPYQSAAILYWDMHCHAVGLGAFWCVGASSDWAMPTFVSSDG